MDRLGGSVWLLVVIAMAGCGGGAGSSDYSKAISHDILIEGTQRVQHVTNSVGGSGRAIINGARCIRTAGTQTYSCIVHYTYENSEGTYRYEVPVSAVCERGGICRWHVNGSVTLVGAEPD
jgi:hypothetical protein